MFNSPPAGIRPSPVPPAPVEPAQGAGTPRAAAAATAEELAGLAARTPQAGQPAGDRKTALSAPAQSAAAPAFPPPLGDRKVALTGAREAKAREVKQGAATAHDPGLQAPSEAAVHAFEQVMGGFGKHSELAFLNSQFGTDCDVQNRMTAAVMAFQSSLGPGVPPDSRVIKVMMGWLVKNSAGLPYSPVGVVSCFAAAIGGLNMPPACLEAFWDLAPIDVFRLGQGAQCDVMSGFISGLVAAPVGMTAIPLEGARSALERYADILVNRSFQIPALMRLLTSIGDELRNHGRRDARFLDTRFENRAQQAGLPTLREVSRLLEEHSVQCSFSGGPTLQDVPAMASIVRGALANENSRALAAVVLGRCDWGRNFLASPFKRNRDYDGNHPLAYVASLVQSVLAWGRHLAPMQRCHLEACLGASLSRMHAQLLDHEERYPETGLDVPSGRRLLDAAQRALADPMREGVAAAGSAGASPAMGILVSCAVEEQYHFAAHLDALDKRRAADPVEDLCGLVQFLAHDLAPEDFMLARARVLRAHPGLEAASQSSTRAWQAPDSSLLSDVKSTAVVWDSGAEVGAAVTDYLRLVNAYSAGITCALPERSHIDRDHFSAVARLRSGVVLDGEIEFWTQAALLEGHDMRGRIARFSPSRSSGRGLVVEHLQTLRGQLQARDESTALG